MLNEHEKALKKARAARFYEKHKDQIKQTNKAWRLDNKESQNSKSLAYYRSHRESCLARMANRAAEKPRTYVSACLKHKYRMSLEEYELILMSQNWGCAICGGVNSKGKRLSVDHDHRTNEVRGLLCNPCNLAIGWMRDDQTRLRCAANYLERTMNNRPHSNIKIERYKDDPEAQGVIKPTDGKWQLVVDKDGYPHLYVESTIEDEDGSTSKGMLCIEDLFITGMTVKDIMEGAFGGKLSPEEEAAAQLEYERSRAETGIPCPR